jgi:hypothetical protein
MKIHGRKPEGRKGITYKDSKSMGLPVFFFVNQL